MIHDKIIHGETSTPRVSRKTNMKTGIETKHKIFQLFHENSCSDSPQNKSLDSKALSFPQQMSTLNECTQKIGL